MNGLQLTGDRLMETQTYTLLDSRPVLLSTLHSDFSLARDWAEGEQEIRRILEAHPEPLFLVSDTREFKLSLDDLIAAANLGSRGEDPIWHHPKMRGVYFISTSKLIELAGAGLNSPMFGNTVVKVFPTLEEVLADVESVMAGESDG
jgi:hypothetical protein